MTRFLCFSLQVFLPVRPPGPAHEEAHLRAKRRGVGEEKKQKENEEEERQEERGMGSQATNVHPVHKPVGGHDACRAAYPSERAVKIKRTHDPLNGDGNWRKTRSS